MELDPIPVAVLLVKDGSRGDKLLFKYPYCTLYEDEYYYEKPEPNETQEGSKDEQETGSNKTDADAAIAAAAAAVTTTTITTTSAITPGATSAATTAASEQKPSGEEARNPFAYTDPDSDPFAATECPTSNIDKNGQLTGFSDKAISNLLAVKSKMCNGRFELQVNDVRFVGHPMLIDSGKTPLQMFHLAFVLNAGLDPEIVNGYYSLVQRLAVGLEYMDHIKKYLTKHVTSMLTAHEEPTSRAMSEETPLDPYDHIATSNELAKELITIFNKLCSTGECTTNLGNWFNVSFVMPHKVFANLPVGKYFNFARMCSRRRRLLRYMSVLLLRERTCFQAPQFPLVTPSIKRVLDVTSATSTLYKTAADADIVYDHLVDIVGHFAHWGMMMVIYPLCNKNLYVLSSKVIDIITSHNLQRAYRKRFPQSNVTLQQQLQRFNTPITPEELTEMATTLEHKYEGFFTILWLLECGLITQVHKFVYISVPVGCKDKLRRRLRTKNLPGTSTSSEALVRDDRAIASDVSSNQTSSRGGHQHEGSAAVVSGADAVPGNTGSSGQTLQHRAPAIRRRRVGRSENCFLFAKKPKSLEENQKRNDFDASTAEQCNRSALTDPEKISVDALKQKNKQWNDDKIWSAETAEQRQAAIEEALLLESKFPSSAVSGTVDSVDPDELLRDTKWFNYDLLLQKDQEKIDREMCVWNEQKEAKKEGDELDVACMAENASDIQSSAGGMNKTTVSVQQPTSSSQEPTNQVADVDGDACDAALATKGDEPDVGDEGGKKNKKTVSWGKPRSAAGTDKPCTTASTPSASGKTPLSSTSPEAATLRPAHDTDDGKSGSVKDRQEDRDDTEGGSGPPWKGSPPDSSARPGQETTSTSGGGRARGSTRRGRGRGRRGSASKPRRGHDGQTSSTPTASGRDGSSTRSGGVGDPSARSSGGARGGVAGKGPGASPGGPEGGYAEEEELVSLLTKARLTFQERCAALSIYAEYPDTVTFKDMKTFLRLTEFFRGAHHIEEMMYTTNLSRSTILGVIDKFSLMLCVTEGPARNYPIVVD